MLYINHFLLQTSYYGICVHVCIYIAINQHLDLLCACAFPGIMVFDLGAPTAPISLGINRITAFTELPGTQGFFTIHSRPRHFYRRANVFF